MLGNGDLIDFGGGAVPIDVVHLSSFNPDTVPSHASAVTNSLGVAVASVAYKVEG